MSSGVTKPDEWTQTLQRLFLLCEQAWSYGSTTLRDEDYYAIQEIVFGTEGATTGHGTGTAASVGSADGGASPQSEVGAE